MLKWQGDFTLPRLRAKLATKYSLHPDVEPEYAEVYHPELSQTVISRKGSFTYLGDALVKSKSEAGAQRGLRKDIRDVPFSERKPFRTNSVPCLGTRRAMTMPCIKQPLPPGMKVDPPRPFDRTPSASSLANAAAAAAKHVETDDPRALEKERQSELASRRFWIASGGNQHFLQEELSQLKLEDPSVSNQAILAKLKNTQVCNQMNKARKEGAKVDWRSADWDGATLLLKAVRTGSMALAMHLIAIGADTTLVDNHGRGLLHWTAVEGNCEMADYIFDTIPDLQPEVTDDGGDTPLHLAAYHGHLEVVRLLVRSGVSVAEVNSGGFTALELATARRHWHVVNYLNEYRLQQEDQASKDTAQLKDLLRPCNVHRATEVRKQYSDMPKPKK